MLAIIIPYFKINFFEDTLQSLASQTDQRFFVYIGDDASPNSPEKLLLKCQGKFNFIYKKFEKNCGKNSLVQQWERCISMLENEQWFMILGDDDVLSPNLVEEFYKNIEKADKNSNVIRIASQLIDEQNKPLSKIYYQKILENAISSYYDNCTGKNRSSLSEYIFRKETYLRKKFRDYKLAWNSDVRAVLDVSDGKDIYSINEALVMVRTSEFSISGKKNNETEKYKANVHFLREFLQDYINKLDREQKIFFTKSYDNQFFLIQENKIFDVIFLLYLNLKYLGIKKAFIFIKSFYYKIVNGKQNQ